MPIGYVDPSLNLLKCYNISYMDSQEPNHCLPFESYDERFPNEVEHDTPLPATSHILTEVSDILNAHSPQIKTIPSTTTEVEHETDSLLYSFTANIPIIDLESMGLQEIEFDVNAINTYDLFKSLLQLDLTQVKTGIFRPRVGTTINSYLNSLRIDVDKVEFDPMIEKYSVSLQRLQNPANHFGSVLEVCIDEYHSTINRYLHGTTQDLRYNLIYLAQDGRVRIIGNNTSEADYLIDRANTLSVLALSTIKRAIEALKQ